MGSINLFGGGPSTVKLTNNTGKTLNVEVRSNSAATEYVSGIPNNSTETCHLPSIWSGNFIKDNGSDQDPTQNEISFSAGNKMTYDQSEEDGYNGPVTLTAPGGSDKGLKTSLFNAAPASMKSTAAGNPVLSNDKSSASLAFYNKQLAGPNGSLLGFAIDGEDQQAQKGSSMITAAPITATFGSD